MFALRETTGVFMKSFLTRRGCRFVAAALFGCLIVPENAFAWTETVLHSFQGGSSDGAWPRAKLIMGSSGALFGATEEGGSGNCSAIKYSGCGTVFELTNAGGDWSEKLIHAFAGGTTDGAIPLGNLIIDAKTGNLYGTTWTGGASTAGTIFAVTPGGSETTAYSFCAQDNCADGSYPVAGLVESPARIVYGTTKKGGTGDYCSGYCGTVFSYNLGTGVENVIHDFTEGPNDGSDGGYPSASLIRDSKGNLYGTTLDGGTDIGCKPYGCGTVFEMSLAKDVWTETTLYRFCPNGIPNCYDGAYPLANVIGNQSNVTYLYGTTWRGGDGLSGSCEIPSKNCGVVFKLEVASPNTETVIHPFCKSTGCSDGNYLSGGLILEDGYLYGTTQQGGAYHKGTVFQISLATGKEAVLYSFCLQSGCPDGFAPAAGLIADGAGDLYGTTAYGGSGACKTSKGVSVGCGTVFELINDKW